jgi:hypothetical protein
MLTKCCLPFIEPKQGYFSSILFDNVELGEGLCLKNNTNGSEQHC